MKDQLKPGMWAIEYGFNKPMFQIDSDWIKKIKKNNVGKQNENGFVVFDKLQHFFVFESKDDLKSCAIGGVFDFIEYYKGMIKDINVDITKLQNILNRIAGE